MTSSPSPLPINYADGLALQAAEDARRCARDLVALSTLPIAFRDCGSEELARTMVGAVLSILRAEGVILELLGTGGAPVLATATRDRKEARTMQWRDAAPTLLRRARGEGGVFSDVSPGGHGKLRFCPFPIGPSGQDGLLLVGYSHDLTEADRLIGNVAANQTAVAVESAARLTALRESEERFRHMADHAPVMVWVTEPDGRCTFLSKSWYEFTGQNPETGLGLGWVDSVHPDDRERSAKIFLAANARHEPFSLDYRLRRKDGEYRWVIDAASPRFNAGREFLGYVGSVIDITERRRAEELIRDVNATLEKSVKERTAELEAANKELEAFSYSVSHDLRSPLRAMDGYSNLLLREYKGKLDEKGEGYLVRIAAGAQRMGQLIDDFVKLSQVGGADVVIEQVDLSATAEKIAVELREKDPGRTVDLHIRPGVIATGDARLLRIVLDNLLENAWKFTRKRPKARIEVGLTLERGETVYFVRDDGDGFDMAYAGKLFKPFERLHATDEFPGTGIGLATVRRIILRHGGRAWAEGAPGRGATVYFTLGTQQGQTHGA